MSDRLRAVSTLMQCGCAACVSEAKRVVQIEQAEMTLHRPIMPYGVSRDMYAEVADALRRKEYRAYEARGAMMVPYTQEKTMTDEKKDEVKNPAIKLLLDRLATVSTSRESQVANRDYHKKTAEGCDVNAKKTDAEIAVLKAALKKLGHKFAA